MNKATISKLVSAYTDGMISQETLSAIELCDIRHNYGNIQTSLGQFINATDVMFVQINDNVVEEYFDKGYTFYGIVPDDINHAIQLVLEHEVVHMIIALQYKTAPMGHSKLFLALAGFIFEHRNADVEEGVND